MRCRFLKVNGNTKTKITDIQLIFLLLKNVGLNGIRKDFSVISKTPPSPEGENGSPLKGFRGGFLNCFHKNKIFSRILLN